MRIEIRNDRGRVTRVPAKRGKRKADESSIPLVHGDIMSRVRSTLLRQRILVLCVMAI